jgi:predicted dehydrogenase
MSPAVASNGKTGPVGVGFIGVGNISDAYLTNLTKFPDVKVLFLSDIDTARAAAQAEKWGVPQSGTVEELLAHPDVEIVVNLTIPAAHAEVDLRIIAAGKHVWSEKPYAVTRESAQAVKAAAEAAGVLVCVAPDTILGGGIQTGLRAIKAGKIGKPLTAVTMFQVGGPEAWHPSPEFLFATGGGPLMDMGPYYISTLVSIFGAASRVMAIGSKARETRVIATGPKAGTEFPVEEPTHVSALVEFAGGGSAQMTYSFESKFFRMGFVEINGSENSIVLPDPNMFDGESKLLTGYDMEKGLQSETLEVTGTTYGRGTGVLEMAQAIREGRPVRIPGDIAFHVLDIMLAIRESIASGQWVVVDSSLPEINALPVAWDPMDATL